jgi:hypothetical protein
VVYVAVVGYLFLRPQRAIRAPLPQTAKPTN